jgi:rubredoxin
MPSPGAQAQGVYPIRYRPLRSCRETDYSPAMTDEPPYSKWMCLTCGFIYDEAVGIPEEGLPAGTRWDKVPPNWTCQECGARKEDFEMVKI